MPAVPAPAELGAGPDVCDGVRADLAALSGGEESGSVCLAAIERLEHLSIVEGAPTPAAAAIAHHLAAALGADAVRDAGVRVEVLYLLGQIAEASMAPIVGGPGGVAADDHAHDEAVLACRALLPAILAAAEHVEDDPEEDVRVEAADTAEAAQEALDAL